MRPGPGSAARAAPKPRLISRATAPSDAANSANPRRLNLDKRPKTPPPLAKSGEPNQGPRFVHRRLSGADSRTGKYPREVLRVEPVAGPASPYGGTKLDFTGRHDCSDTEEPVKRLRRPEVI